MENEIELLVIGMALGGAKDVVCNTLADEDFSEATKSLITSIRCGKTKPFIEWLAERGVSVNTGNSVKQALIDSLVSRRERAIIKSAYGQMSMASRLSNKLEFVALIESIAQQLKGS